MIHMARQSLLSLVPFYVGALCGGCGDVVDGCGLCCAGAMLRSKSY